MKKIIAIIQKDLISTSRDAIFLYVAVAPILIGLAFRFFLPGVGQASLNVVVLENTSQSLVEELGRYFNVELEKDRPALEERVLAYDDSVGIIPQDDGTFQIILEGNETHDSQVLPAMAVRQIQSGMPISYTSEDINTEKVANRALVATFLAFGVLFLASLLMSLHIIEDKESNLFQAMGVTPLSKTGYVMARSTFVILISLVTVFASLWIFGFQDFNALHLVITILVSVISSILFGLFIGAISSNQIAGMANIKFGFMLVLGPAVASLLIPENYQFFMYWLPTYWSFISFKGVLMDGLQAASLWQPLLYTFLISVIFLVAAFPWLRKKMEFARD